MTICSDDALPARPASPRKPRPGRELVADLFQTLAGPLVTVLHRLRVPPPAVVVAHATVGAAAAAAIAADAFVAAAALLQLKTLLDNTDGQLARLGGRVSAFGRYLDTELDFAVNVALFAALGLVTGAPVLAAAAFLGLTLVLSLDYNLAALHDEALARAPTAPAASGRVDERVLARVYDAVFGPQDRMVRAFSRRRLERVVGSGRREDLERADRPYHDRATLTVLANLGLSTHLLALGLCLVVAAPELYLWLVVASLGVLPFLQLRRERLARRALAA